jgi:spore coat protein CotH
MTEGEIKNDEYINCKIEVNDKKSSEAIELINSKIKIRGRYNAELPKKGYRIELDQEKSLLGLRKDDDWLLLAMYSDLNNLQIKLSFDLYRTLTPSNPTAILPDSEYVCLNLNGDFQGLYLLTEKNDRRLFGLDDAQNNINSSLIFQSSYFHNNFESYNYDEWEQDWPNEYDDIYIMDEIMTSLVSFVRDSSDEEFFNPELGVYAIFDRLNLIDFYIFNFFILHDDFWDHNYFIVRNTYPSKFFLVPWDFDRCFGQWLSRNGDPERNDEEFIRNNNQLFNRLLNYESFKLDIKNRWQQLRMELWTEQEVMDRVSENYEKIKEILEIDSEIWLPWLFGDDWEKKLDESIDWLYDWIPKRLEFCDSYFFEL